MTRAIWSYNGVLFGLYVGLYVLYNRPIFSLV